MIHHLTRATRHLIFWGLLFSAVALTAIRLLLAGVSEYKNNLEIKIGAELGVPVKLGSLSAAMQGFTPQLVIKNIDVVPALATEKTPLHVREIRWGINLGDYLLHRQLLPSSSLTLIGADLSAYRDSDGHVGIVGLKPRTGKPLWLFQGQYQLLDSNITWEDRFADNTPVLLENLNVAVFNEGDRHRLNAIVQLREKKGGEIRLSADVSGDIEKPEQLEGRAYLEASQIGLSDLLSAYSPAKVDSGTGDFKVWSHWQPNKPANFIVNAVLDDVVLTRNDVGRLPISKAVANVNFHFDADFWRADVRHLQIQIENTSGQAVKPWPDAAFSVGHRRAKGAIAEAFSLYAEKLELAEAAQLAGFFLPPSMEGRGYLKQAEMHGALSGFAFYSEPASRRFALAGRFDDVGFKPFGAVPGISHATGRIKTSETTGALELDSRESTLEDARIFSKPVTMQKMNGLFNWRHDADGWQISSPSAQLDCSAFKSLSRGSVLISANGASPFVDLQIRFSSDNAGQIKHFLPVQIMREKLKNWLSNAFLGGKVEQGELLYYGETANFPFSDNTGVFQARMDLRGISLKYHPDWPQIDDIQGVLALDKDLIEGKFDGGKAGQSKIGNTAMLISDIGNKPVLHIQGKGMGDALEMIKALQQSPLANRVNPLLNHTRITGTAKASLDLTVPFSPDQTVSADVTALLNNVEIAPKQVKLPLGGINGQIKFSREGAYGKDIHANFLGRPADVSVDTLGKQAVITINGKMAVSDWIQQAGALPDKFKANGESTFRLALKTPQPEATKSELQVNLQTDLDGIELSLPGGLAKTSVQKKPLALALNLVDKATDLPITLNFNNELKAAFRYGFKEHKITSGHFLMGSGTVGFPAVPGIKLEISRTPLALEDWLQMASGTGTQGLDGGFREITLHSQNASWQKNPLGAFELSLRRNPDFWSGEIDSRFARGIFDVPSDLGSFKPAVLTMEMLDLSQLRKITLNAGETSSALKVVPTLRSNKTIWRSEDLGRLSLDTEHIPLGLKIKQLSIQGEDETLAVTGIWEQLKSASVTQLQGNLKMRRADLLFSKLNITKDFAETSGEVNFQLKWNSPPFQLSLANLKGHMDVNLKHGRILSIEPGFGRILGILAIEQWIKRLQLDFTDIFAEGLTYNSIQGDFDLSGGRASTQNLLIDSVPAMITITGDTDLVKQTVDHRIKVVPKSSDAVPIAGTIVGKVASLIGKTLTGKSQDGFFFGRQYLVKGEWNSASIKPLHEDDGILQKTWNNITDFPWVE